MSTASLKAYKDAVGEEYQGSPGYRLSQQEYIHDEAEWLLSVLTLQKTSSLGAESDLLLIRGHLSAR
jgi:hypothetical protein